MQAEVNTDKQYFEKISTFQSLSFRLTFYALTIALVPLIVMTSVALLQSRTQLEKTLKSEMLIMAKSESHSIADWLQEQVNHISYMAKLPQVRSLEYDQYTSILSKAVEDMPAFGTFYLVNQNGMQIYKTDNSALSNLSDREYFQRAMKGETLIGDVVISKSKGNLLIPIAAPVKDENGRVIAVLAGSLYLDTLTNALQEMQFGNSGEILLLNEEGYFITGSRFTEELKASGAIKERVELELQSEAEEVKNALNGVATAKSYTDYRSERTIGAFAPLQAANVNWALVVKQDESEAYAEINKQLVLLAIITLVIAVGIGIGATFYTRDMVTDLNWLVKAGVYLSIGDWKMEEITLKVRKKLRGRKDEIGAVSRTFTRMIAYQEEKTEATNRIAAGDLTVEVTPMCANDYQGNSLKQMIARLRELIRNVQQSANTVNNAAKQLSQASEQAGQATSQITLTMQQIASGTNNQAQAATLTAQTMERMNRVVDGIERGAQEQMEAVDKTAALTDQLASSIQTLADASQSSAEGGKANAEASQMGAQTVNNTIQAINTIRSKVGQSAEKVQEMGEKSNQIGVIVETIEDIASQTNLLALNAAIEAARAGEQGKGFSVVADEVRKLAERSSNATKEIGELIKSIQATVKEAVAAMNEGIGEVENGVLAANQAGEALQTLQQSSAMVAKNAYEAVGVAKTAQSATEELASAIANVSHVVSENQMATKEMTRNSSEVNQAIENIASISEENSAAVEEVSASTEEMTAQVEEVNTSAQTLAEMADELMKQVLYFKIA